MNQPDELSTLDGSFPRHGLGNPPSTTTISNETVKTLFERHTVRRFLDAPVEPEKLDIIVNAGLHAPNAGGCQAPIFLVSQDAAVNLELGRISNDLYDEGFYPVSNAQPSIACGVGITNAFYDAPIVITVFTPKDWSYAALDAGMAASNVIIAASSLGLGSCIVSRAARTFATPYGLKVKTNAGIPDDYEAQLHVVIGYPESKAHDQKTMYPNRVSWIC